MPKDAVDGAVIPVAGVYLSAKNNDRPERLRPVILRGGILLLYFLCCQGLIPDATVPQALLAVSGAWSSPDCASASSSAARARASSACLAARASADSSSSCRLRRRSVW
jgi:hypothetical protein